MATTDELMALGLHAEVAKAIDRGYAGSAAVASVAGTVEANKAVVVGADKNIDTLAIAASGLKIGAGAGTAVTATAAEINTVAAVTAGTVTASKAVVVDANKRIDTIVIADGGLKLGTGAGTAVTSTAAELNILDGVTATTGELNTVAGVTPGTVAASKAIVVDANKRIDALVVADGGLSLGTGAGTAITATATELNTLDGITSTTLELNILDGVTATAGEINTLAGVTAGTVAASKAVVVDASKNVDHIGLAAGGNFHPDDGTATAVAGAATLNKMAGVITSEALTTAAAAEYTLTLTNSEVAAADMVFASVQYGTATAGTPVVTRVTPAAGSVVIVIKNDHATLAFDGTIKIAFLVLTA